jgi:hypothetical protein
MLCSRNLTSELRLQECTCGERDDEKPSDGIELNKKTLSTIKQQGVYLLVRSSIYPLSQLQGCESILTDRDRDKFSKYDTCLLHHFTCVVWSISLNVLSTESGIWLLFMWLHGLQRQGNGELRRGIDSLVFASTPLCFK